MARRLAVLGLLAVVAWSANRYYERRIDRILHGDYDNGAICRRDWWTRRAELRATPWVRIRTNHGVVALPEVRFNACLYDEGQKLQVEAHSAFTARAEQAETAAASMFESALPSYLDDRYSGWKAIGHTLGDTGRMLGAWLRSDWETAKKELGRAAAEAERNRLETLFDYPVRQFNGSMGDYFDNRDGAHQQWVRAHAAALIARAVQSGVIDAHDESAGRVGGVDGRTSVAVGASPTLGALPRRVIRFGTFVAVGEAVGVLSLSTRVALLSRVALPAIAFPAVVTKIDEAFNRTKVAAERRDEMKRWLTESRASAMAVHDWSLAQFDASVRAHLVQAAQAGTLTVDLAP